MDASFAGNLLSSDECQKRWQDFQSQANRAKLLSSVKVFYSSVLGGLTKDPSYFTIPVDDHGFHRGDGVFEALRVVKGVAYLKKMHLDRLERSAAHIGLQLPFPRSAIENLIQSLIQYADTDSLILRLYATRGGGGFGVSPQECSKSNFFGVATLFQNPDPVNWEKGVSLGLSSVAVKPGVFAQIKSLNYLPNVLMKAEAQKAGFDFAVGLDEQGQITEGATENVAIINAKGELCHPQFNRILDGCTLRRVFQLAEALPGLKLQASANLKLQDLIDAQEILLIGTTLDVTPVTRFQDRKLEVGPWARKLLDLVRRDQTSS